MKTFLTINLEYMYAIRQAEELESIAKQLEGCRIRYDSCDRQTGVAWKGDNSEYYRKKLRTAEDNSEKLRAYTVTLAQTIRRIAKRTYDAELKNLEIARKRTYG